MSKWILVAASVLLSLLVNAGPARADSSGTLQGKVINGSSGGGSAGGIEVALHVLQGEQAASTLSATTDAEGAFRFEGLDTGSDWSYLLRTAYQGVTYSAGPLQYEEGKSLLDTELRVYEPTTDDQFISVGKAHLFLQPSGSRLGVTELYILVNPGDRTYTGREEAGGRRWTSRFLLPAKSQDLEFFDGSLGGRFVSVDGGFVDTEPLWPGQTSVMFQYTVDCPQGECTLSRKLTYRLPSLNVLVPDTGVTIESDRLVREGNVEAQGASYLNYVGGELAAGETVQLRLRGSGEAAGRAGGTPSNGQSLPWILLGGVIGLVVVGYPFWRQRIRAADGAGPGAKDSRRE